MPRCGMPDNMGHALDAKRKKRYSLGSRWSKLDLTYRIDSRTPDITNPTDVDDTMAAAFKVRLLVGQSARNSFKLYVYECGVKPAYLK